MLHVIEPTEVIAWGKSFLKQSEQEITPEELKEQKKYAILIENPSDKALLSRMLDESSQIKNNKKLARRMKLLIERYGVPKFFGKSDAFLLRLFTSVGFWFDFLSVPIFKNRLRADTSNVIINEAPQVLNSHLNKRRAQQIGQNVNLLGEVVLGDGEAKHRFEHYLQALKDPRINYISIKISGIYAQINALNYAQNKTDLCALIAQIYQQAIDFPYTDEQGYVSAKFVNLDMEEYKDAELTLDVFMTVLAMPQFKHFTAGIVVQAYLPDAWNFQSSLLLFAKERLAEGGAPLKMRLVKGANLQMESIVSSLKGWDNPVLGSKIEVDANYLHILDRALLPENAQALHVGVASHNFFSIGYAFLLAKQHGVEQFVTFEMLEGMANHLPRVIRQLGNQIILYTPVVKDENFLNAVSYLVRRLDENTGVDNFLSYSFNLKVDSEHWNFLQHQFEQAYQLKDKMQPLPKRTQDRTKLEHPRMDGFRNEPDTNFDLPANRAWAASIRNKWMKNADSIPTHIPVQCGEQELVSSQNKTYYDHNSEELIPHYQVDLASLEQVKMLVEVAEQDASRWRETSLQMRKEILFRTAELLAAKRGDMIGCMAAVTGKTFTEGDVECSEAIDLCRYYPLSMEKFENLQGVRIAPKGIVLVIPPWNFPLAIPVGGVAAALAGGNTVILKPATVAFPVAWEFAQCFWQAGVPKDALQLVCTAGSEPLRYLTAHHAIQHIIMTGGTDTAFRLLQNNPTCPLSAETGGKNAIIVTAAADRDHAVQNIITSAFSNAGQKCSACSLLILEKEVYNDADFKRKLTDAVKSIHTGSAWQGANYVGAMITSTNEKLLHATEHLEPGEWWLVEPNFIDSQKFMLKPCVKWGVKAYSYTFKNELFGPLLAVVCASNFEHAIALANSSEFGLTAGLQTLDESERAYWVQHIDAGNLYINRGITGAIVNRQPFGGMKRSAFGGGIKAGGPNYVSSFVSISNHPDVKKHTQGENIGAFKIYSALLRGREKVLFEYAVTSYLESYESEFSQVRDINQLLGEQNLFRYLALKNIMLRVHKKDTLNDLLLVVAAATISKTPLYISIDPNDSRIDILKTICPDKSVLVQNEKIFLEEMEKYERIRTCTDDLSMEIYQRAAVLGKYIATQQPLIEGRLELLHYLKEQSISFEYHRYGSITEKPILIS
ncbi:MAG: proline dehydrogenase [Porphyromonadaceae bacterium CG2_30_38_12]|nr:MAG: proline dehydrogenase [Porphyromonadaceae bacterium CG2_30_38_12]